MIELNNVRNEVELTSHKNDVELNLRDVKTVNYGFMGMQTYEGVEPVGEDNN